MMWPLASLGPWNSQIAICIALSPFLNYTFNGGFFFLLLLLWNRNHVGLSNSNPVSCISLSSGCALEMKCTPCTTWPVRKVKSDTARSGTWSCWRGPLHFRRMINGVCDCKNKHFNHQNRISSVLKKCIVIQCHFICPLWHTNHAKATKYHFISTSTLYSQISYCAVYMTNYSYVYHVWEYIISDFEGQ